MSTNQRSWEPKPLEPQAAAPQQPSAQAEPGTPGGGYKQGGQKFMKNGLKYAGKCQVTGQWLPEGTKAWYDFDTKQPISVDARPAPRWYLEEQAAAGNGGGASEAS